MPKGDEKNSEEQTNEGGSQEERFEGEFDAARAARLIENLRSEVADLKKDRDALRTKEQEREDSEKSEIDRLKDALERSEGEAKSAKREAALSRAQAKHGLSDEDVEEFLDGVDEDKIEQRAARLAERLGTGSQEERGGEDGGEENPEDDGLSGKPKPGLTPGTGGDSDDGEIDVDALVSGARERRGY